VYWPKPETGRGEASLRFLPVEIVKEADDRCTTSEFAGRYTSTV